MTDGAFAPDGTFIQRPSASTESILRLWEDKVFALLLAEGKIDQSVVEQMKSWVHSGFSVDASVYLSAGDVAGLERLAQYLVRCPLSLARIVRVTDSGPVVSRAEKTDCHPFPGAASGDLRGGPRRNFQVFDACYFLAELTLHIPDKGEHLVRYYGWYAPRQRGQRARQRAAGEISIDRSLIHTFLVTSSWAVLIHGIYEVDPLTYPHCGGRMKIISFIESRQRDVIEKILRHCGLWEGGLRTLPHSRGPPSKQPADGTASPPRELQLVLDPEFL